MNFLGNADAVIIGGGFYGSLIAIYLVKERRFKRVVIIEVEKELMQRASFNNQARVHNGYHYPRNFTTAFRSQVNFPKFLTDWPTSIYKDFVKLYAISRKNSKVSSKQFFRFCKQIGAEIDFADNSLKKYFDTRLIEDVFKVNEVAFDSKKLASLVVAELKSSGVEIYYSTRALSVNRSNFGESFRIHSKNSNGSILNIDSKYVFNCTYCGLNQISGEFSGTATELKHEIAEMALIKVPEQLEHLGVTVMDGPFFSVMPFPSSGMHTISHVRYTPHKSWQDHVGVNPYDLINDLQLTSKFDRMIRDASKYMPLLQYSKYNRSLYDVKTVLMKNESNDGRPILFERHSKLVGCYSVLGGKIDNIYDVLDMLDKEPFEKIRSERKK